MTMVESSTPSPESHTANRMVISPLLVFAASTVMVVWSHPVEDGRYDTGVFFSELEEEQREILRSFVQASA